VGACKLAKAARLSRQLFPDGSTPCYISPGNRRIRPARTSRIIFNKEFVMTSLAALRGALFAAALGLAVHAHADSFASSASSAGSASSGSMSDSLQGSSNSATGGNRHADGNYRILDIDNTPGRAGSTRVAMQGDDPQQRIVLDLPQAVFAKQGLGCGDLVHAQNRPYGIEFARADTREAFFLVLEDTVYHELAARKVTL
jgi:hypothetical protein